MKGLLLKDFYMMRKYCKAHLLLTIVFLIASLYGDGDVFYILYPCMFAGTIPITLLGYDEQSKWNEFCETLPYTKAQIVSAKYLLGLLTQLAVVAAFSVTLAIKMNLNKTFETTEFLSTTLLLFTVSLSSASLCMPFIFKFGVEKGRLAYYLMIGLFCGASAVASVLTRTDSLSVTSLRGFETVCACIISVLLYALSWYLSIVFHKKREV